MAAKKTKKAKPKAKKPAKKPVKKSAPKKAKKAKPVRAKKPVKKPKAKKPAAKKKVPAKKKPVKRAKAKKPAVVAKPKPAPQIIEDMPVGRVTHYFDQIEVGVIELTEDLVVGEVIRIVGGEDTDFKQAVESMELDHDKIDKAKKGKEIGMKLKKKAREGYRVYRVKG